MCDFRERIREESDRVEILSCLTLRGPGLRADAPSSCYKDIVLPARQSYINLDGLNWLQITDRIDRVRVTERTNGLTRAHCTHALSPSLGPLVFVQLKHQALTTAARRQAAEDEDI